MLRSPHTLFTLLRIGVELDIIGDITVTVDTPSVLLAWAHALPQPTICAWRADDSGTRYVHVSASCHQAPVRGQVTAVLNAERHRSFWSALLPEGDLAPGDEQLLPPSALVTAWSTTTPPSCTTTPPPAPAPTHSRDAS